ncbi:MAG: hypothetical protein HGB12_10580 [Bacteroidetes bacterium]|nr:hypothetical protein [Bacteroidota bacterium]
MDPSGQYVTDDELTHQILDFIANIGSIYTPEEEDKDKFFAERLIGLIEIIKGRLHYPKWILEEYYSDKQITMPCIVDIVSDYVAEIITQEEVIEILNDLSSRMQNAIVSLGIDYSDVNGR